MVHLTNNFLQKKNDNYEKYESGNSLPLEDFKNYINQTFGSLDIDFEEDIMKKIKDLIIDSFLATKVKFHLMPLEINV